jgi:nicotinamidase/pyrazinamidase
MWRRWSGREVEAMVSYDEKTALIVTDVQNDFAHPDGSLYVRGGEEVLPVVNREIELALDAGAVVVYTQDWHPPSTPHFQKDGGVWPVHCVMETWGADFLPELNVAGDVVRKGTSGEDGYSGFSVRDPVSGREERTRLGSLLEEAGIERLVVTGIATDYCVKETALDGLRMGYRAVVLAEAVRAVDLQPGDGDRALDAVREAGGTVE